MLQGVKGFASRAKNEFGESYRFYVYLHEPGVYQLPGCIIKHNKLL